MNHSASTRSHDRRHRAAAHGVFSLIAGLLLTSRLHAQSPDEHASHHPGAPPAAGTSAAAPGAPPAGAAGMMAGMGEMMKGMMGASPPKELYPTLMALPTLSPAQRAQVAQQAGERMRAGTTLIGQALDTLNFGAQSGDYAAMHSAMTRLREGTAQLESGITARRALAEGRAPREVALTWFKRELSLTVPVEGADPHGVRGLSPFHLFTMALLVVFAAALLAMYFFKMRRASALFGRIEPGASAPPPGSPPPLSGSTAPPNPAAPLTAKWAGRLRVESIIRETPSVLTFRLLTPGGSALPFTFAPGQFLNVAFGIGGARMNRSYSISSSPNERAYVDLTVKREERGAVSRHIVDLLRVGDEIEAGGPVGKFTFTGAEAESVVLIGAGVGITPMMSIARYLTEQSWPGDIYYIYGCRAPADLIFGPALAALALRNPKLHVAVTMSKPTPDWPGARGRITKDFLLRTVPDLASRRVQLCGPPTMMDGIKDLLLEIGVAPANLKTEAFGAVKPPLPALGPSALPTAPATGPLVTFSANHKSARIHADQTVLELSEDLGIGIQYSCRVGTCGLCKVKMTAGEVDMAIDDALDADDKATGVILACQAKPKGEVTVEA